MRQIRLLLLTFLVLTMGVMALPVLYLFVGYFQLRYISVVQALAVVILLWATVRCSRVFPQRDPPGGIYMMTVYAFGGMLVLMFFWGLLRDNFFYTIIQEMWIFVIMFCFLILGRYDEVWEMIEKPMILLLCLGFLLILVGLDRPGFAYWGKGGFEVTAEFLTAVRAEAQERKGETLAYDIRGVVSAWPLIFAAAALMPRWNVWKALGILAAPLFAILQVFAFKFRSELGMALVQMALVGVAVVLFLRRAKLGTVLILFLFCAAGLGIVYGTTDFEKMLGRFVDPHLWTFRRAELESLWHETGPLHLVVGKGAGGYFTSPSIQMWYYRQETHMGVLFPFLKGGVMFSVIYFGLLLRMFLKKPPGWYANRYNAAAMLVVPVYLVWQFMIPFPQTQFTFTAMIVGMGCARLGTLRRPQEAALPPLEAPEAEYLAAAWPQETS